MNESHERMVDPFNPETYRGKVVDIVHIQSVQRVAEGKKQAEPWDVNTAKIVLKRIDQLVQAGVTVRYIDDLNSYTPPTGVDMSSQDIVLGGAFLGQCIAEYQGTLNKNSVTSKIDPLLTVRA